MDAIIIVTLVISMSAMLACVTLMAVDEIFVILRGK